MDRLNHKYQLAFCIAFWVGLAVLGALSHQDINRQGSMSLLKGGLQNAYENTFSASNPLRQFSIDLWGALKYAVLQQSSDGSLIGKDDWLFTTEELTLGENYNAMLNASVQEIVDVHVELESRGITLLPVIIPDKARVYYEKLKYTRSSFLSNRYNVLIDKIKSNGLQAISVLGPMVQAKSKGDVFMQHDTHWSPFGAKIVADHIAQNLNPIELSKVQVDTHFVGTGIFNGDLLRYIPTGGLRPYIGPYESVIEQYQTTVHNNSGLLGDAVIDVVLIGTSFSAKQEWHFEGFLKQALSVDILNMSQEGKGPFVPMQDYLNAEISENTAPKLIIWEIPERYTTQDLSK